LDKLKSYGNRIIEPATGFLASALEGKGRMEEPDTIAGIMEAFFETQNQLDKKKILITAGPTYEKLDPVRYISNYSSGKMGFALAEVCAERGAEVTLISGPVQLKALHPRIRRMDVESAAEMYEQVLACFPATDAAILCAAVADYKPAQFSESKLKRNDKEAMHLELTANQDIAASLGKIKNENQILCGFALETDNELSNAENKLKKKNLDFIVLNSLRDKEAGFQKDTNKISIITAGGEKIDFPAKSKREVAEDIMDFLELRVKN
jgi:phosphopantothenoylcysteine decarboxylase/phosphopantothenate--cysteine ligase